MAALMSGYLRVIQTLSKTNPLVLQQASRSLAAWNKDYKPGPYPDKKCPNEIAKKYNLLPEEYKPYADDGMGYGDYPKLPTGYGIEAKDNYYPYDLPELKRNFNEPINADIDMYGEDRYSQPETPRLTKPQYWFSFLAVMAGCFALYYWLEDKKMYPPVMAKQYPGPGKVHYTFESKNA